MTEAEKLTHARKLNIARRHLTTKQKRILIGDNLEANPEKSDRQHAQELGVSPTTVGNVRKEMENNSQLSKLDTSIGADGKERSRKVNRKPVSVFNPTKREERAPYINVFGWRKIALVLRLLYGVHIVKNL